MGKPRYAVGHMLTLEEVRGLAMLARLELEESELKRNAEQLERVLEYVARLAKVDTSSVPVTEPGDEDRAFRSDVVLPADDVSRELITGNFPERTGEALRVPAVFEKPKG